MEIEPEVPRHDKTPNLKLVMNPEGKLHDWTDLPEEEVPEKIQIAMVGNPEIAKTLSTGLNDCKGRGKVLVDNPDHMFQSSTIPITASFKAAPSFAGSFRQVFNSRRGMFEQSIAGTRPNKTTQITHAQHPCQLARSKTLPDMPKLETNCQDGLFHKKRGDQENEEQGGGSLKRPCIQMPPSSPLVPRRTTSSKQMVAKLSAAEDRRPLRNFFSNA